MNRALPPLALLLVLTLIGVRVAGAPSRPVMREKIRILSGDRKQPGATAEALGVYLDRFSEPADHWFAAEAYLRVGLYGRALAQMLKPGGVREHPETARRFGQMGLEILGWADVEHRQPTAAEPAALVALTEGRVPWAVRLLQTYAQTRPLDGVTPYLFHAIRHGSAFPTNTLLDGMATNSAQTAGDRHKMDIAIAFTRLRAGDYPGRAEDLALLLEVLPTLRRQDLHAWVAATSALGRSEDPAALTALRRIEAGLKDTRTERGVRELSLVRCALLASGDWAAHKRLKPVLAADDAQQFFTSWYLEALLHRFAIQDPDSRIPLGDVWLELGLSDRQARLRIAVALLLQDNPPPTGTPAERGPIQKMVRDLIRMEDAPIGPVLGHAYMIRSGEPGAKDRLFTVMQQIANAWEEDPKGRDDMMRPAWIMGLRALLLYGDTPEHAD